MPRVATLEESSAKISDFDILFSIPLGSLQEIEDQCNVESSKYVYRRRLQDYTLEAEKPVGLFTGECGLIHGTEEGINPKSAGIMWVWVRLFISVLCLRHLTSAAV